MRRAAVAVLLALACREPTAAGPPAPAGNPEGTAARIQARAEVDLLGPRVDAQAGDWVLRGGAGVAVVSVAGKLIDFGPLGSVDELVGIEPAIFAGIERLPAEVARVEPAGEGGRAIYAERRAAGRPLRLRSWFYLSGETLVIESEVVNDGDTPAQAVAPGEVLAWGNIPPWVEGHGPAREARSYTGEFVAREGLGLAYALCSAGGRTSVRIPPSDMAGFFLDPETADPPVVLPPKARSPRRTAFFSVSRGALGDAALRLPCLSRRGTRPWPLPSGLPEGTLAEIAHCAGAGAHLRLAIRPGSTEIRVPAGCFDLRLAAPGHAPGAWMLEPRLDPRQLDAVRPKAGLLRWLVVEPGRGAIPARILVRGVAGTPDPSFGDLPDRGAIQNVIYSERGDGERRLPPGRYRITVDRGFEYAVHEEEVAVRASAPVTVRATLPRLVDTRGWISADLHLHALPSPDAPVPLEDRIRSLVAVGVEVAVASDHNAVTDYAPVIREMGLGRWVASIVGEEVTTKEVLYGHFNVFPLRPEAAPIPWRSTPPERIFAAARAAGPHGRDNVIQVNHPRMRDLGYFEILRFDPRDVAGWHRRTPLADLRFDAIEIFNGDYYHAANQPKIEECLRDWYALLNAGHRFTATGNSDSHQLAFHEAGVPRNLVAVPSDEPGTLDERAFVEAVRRGRVVVVSGPFLRLTANGRGLGETIRPGPAEVEIRVEAPPWVDVDRIQLIRRGLLLREWRGPFRQGVVRFERTERLELAEGDWVIAIARGSRPMAHLHRPDALPLSFTNPIWVAKASP